MWFWLVTIWILICAIAYALSLQWDAKKIENEKKKRDSPGRSSKSRADGEKGKEQQELRQRQRQNLNGSSSPSINNNNDGEESDNLNCVRCNKVLPKPGSSGLLSEPVKCSICSLRVCKTCGVWNQIKNSLTCGHCHPPTSIDKKANFWIDGISHGDASFVTAEQDKTTEQVREHLEQLVESYVDEGIASVSLARLFDNPQYDVLFHRFHQKLSDALMNLGYSLKLGIENKPMNETPTTAHTTLTNLLVTVKEAGMELPLMEPTTQAPLTAPTKTMDPQNPNNKTSGTNSNYEDVLATAILNKVVISGQKSRSKSDSPMSLVDSAVQTDSEMSEASEIVTQKNQYNVQGWVTNLEKRSPQQNSNLSDDDLSMGTSSSNWSNEGASHRGSGSGSHQQIVIEEQVEEITTTYESDSDIGRSPPVVRNRKLRKSGRNQRSNGSSNQNNEPMINTTTVKNDDPLFGVDLSNFDKRAPFPEGGVDIISPNENLELQGDDGDNDVGNLDNFGDSKNNKSASALLVSQISEWEQNWLFKRRKQLFKKRNLLAEAVPMLVPNPNEDGIEPQIGEEKASDLSDLEDHVNEDDEDDVPEDEDDFLSGEEDFEIIEPETEKVTAESEKMKEIEKKILPPPSVVTPDIVSEAKRTKSTAVAAAPKPPKPTTTKPEKPKTTEQKINFATIPKDCQVAAGKTAKFLCAIEEPSPFYSVAWFFEGTLVTSEKGKRWIYSAENRHLHYLYIYDVTEKEQGNYHVSVFDHRGNEIKHQCKLIVTASEQRNLEPPTFTLIQETVKVPEDKNESSRSIPLTIPFEVTGYPEPYLEIHRNNIEISKLSHVHLEDTGDGKWVLQIRQSETNYPIDGEYVAIAKNRGGVTKVTFQIQSDGTCAKLLQTTDSLKAEAQGSNPKSLSPQPQRPISVASQVSSIEETLRETSQSMDRNQTLFKEDYENSLLEWERRNHDNDNDDSLDLGGGGDAGVNNNGDSSKMTIAEREKLKWQNPVNLPNNPYAPENLAKRIRQRENSGFALPQGKTTDINNGVTSSSDDERPQDVDRIGQSYKKFSRDYYVHGVTPSAAKLPVGPRFPPTSTSSSPTSSLPAVTATPTPKSEKAVDRVAPTPSKAANTASTDIIESKSKVPLEKTESSLSVGKGGEKEKFSEPTPAPSSSPSTQGQTQRSTSPRSNSNSNSTPIVSPRTLTPSSASSTPSPTVTRRQRQIPAENARPGAPTGESSQEKIKETPASASGKRNQNLPEKTPGMERIRLPSVKQLAQQFNREKSPEPTRAPNPKESNSKPLTAHPITKNLIKESKSIQQQPAQSQSQAKPLINKVSSVPQNLHENQNDNEKENFATLGHTEKIEPEAQISLPKEIGDFPVDKNDHDQTDGVQVEEDLWKFNENENEELREEETEEVASPPPLPFSPPPSKAASIILDASGEGETEMLALFDPLASKEETQLSPEKVEPKPEKRLRTSTTASADLSMNLPEVPDSYMPKWYQKHQGSGQGSNPNSPGLLSGLHFELMTDEPDHLPASILPDTPQLSSLATTITEDDDDQSDRHDLNLDLDQESVTGVQQPFYKTFHHDDDKDEDQDTPKGSKRNSWNTTSSFAYLQSDHDQDDDSISGWSENTPSIVPAPSRSQSSGSPVSTPGTPRRSVALPKRSNSRVAALAAQFEVNNGKTNGDATSPTSSSSPTPSVPSSAASSPMTQRAPKMKRPTAMEVLATPSPSMLATRAKKDSVDNDEDVDLRKLRRSVMREARKASSLGVDKVEEKVEEKPRRPKSMGYDFNYDYDPNADESNL